jgi:thiosulfate reductase/polysulfide reductase chain A
MAEPRPGINNADLFWQHRPDQEIEEAKVETIVATGLEGGEWKKVMCKLCGNKVWCTAQVYVKDGLILSIAGDPENAASGGKLCARGQAGMMATYNPYRVKAP